LSVRLETAQSRAHKRRQVRKWPWGIFPSKRFRYLAVPWAVAQPGCAIVCPRVIH
jgi:hypothetical protein